MKDDKSMTRKNKPLPESERPDWAKSIHAKEWEKYVHSPQCKACNADHDGRNLRSEIEALVIERKTYVEVCNIMFERYKLRLAPHNISRHMTRHAPAYATILGKLLENDLGEVLRGTHGPVVDAAKFLLGVIQMSFHNAILNPEQVTVSDGIRAAEKLNAITKNLNISLCEDAITQEDLIKLVDIMQEVLTPEQTKELEKRLPLSFAKPPPSPPSPPTEPEQALEAANEEEWIELDGVPMRLDGISDLPTFQFMLEMLLPRVGGHLEGTIHLEDDQYIALNSALSNVPRC